MTSAIISDIHGNVEALQSVLTAIDAMGITDIRCLGDIVGYGASPNECVALVRSRNIPSIAGNHDKAVTGELSIDDFSPAAKAGVEWTRSIATPETLSFLRSLPYSIQEDGVLLVHSSPDRPEDFRYLLSFQHAEESFEQLSSPLCFIGHTHRPVIYGEEGTEKEIGRNGRFIVNVGSVGQPRDGDRRACFVLFDRDAYRVTHQRVEYDIAAAQRKILDAGLPQKLADRLMIGL